jgi:hypothetical protein
MTRLSELRAEYDRWCRTNQYGDWNGEKTRELFALAAAATERVAALEEEARRRSDRLASLAAHGAEAIAILRAIINATGDIIDEGVADGDEWAIRQRNWAKLDVGFRADEARKDDDA